MAKNWKDALANLGERAREILAELGIVEPEPKLQLQPVPVRTNQGKRPHR